MADVFALLEVIEKRASMYVGGETSDRVGQLRNLELLLTGYSLAIEAHGIEEPGSRLLQKFSSYLRERFGWGASAGPVVPIVQHAGEGDAAWETFWRLLWEYRAHVQGPKTVPE